MGKILLPILICLQLFAISAMAQAKWHTYFPADKNFSIQLPVPLQRVMSFEGEHGASLESDQKMELAICYAAIETTPGESRFGIIVISKNDIIKIRPSVSKRDLFKGISYGLIADDDEIEFLKPASKLRYKRLIGKEYFYIDGNSSGLFTRGRILDAGRKIYVLVFVGKNEADLKSPDAEQFFNSFTLRKRR